MKWCLILVALGVALILAFPRGSSLSAEPCLGVLVALLLLGCPLIRALAALSRATSHPEPMDPDMTIEDAIFPWRRRFRR